MVIVYAAVRIWVARFHLFSDKRNGPCRDVSARAIWRVPGRVIWMVNLSAKRSYVSAIANCRMLTCAATFPASSRKACAIGASASVAGGPAPDHGPARFEQIGE